MPLSLRLSPNATIWVNGKPLEVALAEVVLLTLMEDEIGMMLVAIVVGLVVLAPVVVKTTEEEDEIATVLVAVVVGLVVLAALAMFKTAPHTPLFETADMRVVFNQQVPGEPGTHETATQPAVVEQVVMQASRVAAPT